MDRHVTRTPGDGGVAPRPVTDIRGERAAREERPAREERSVGELVRELRDESARLVRQEVELAKTELSEKLRVYTRNAAAIAVGATLLFAAVLALAWAANTGLTALLGQWMELEVAVWLSPLLIAALLGLIGWTLIGKGRRAIAREGIAPHRTARTLREEKDWAERKTKEVRS